MSRRIVIKVTCVIEDYDNTDYLMQEVRDQVEEMIDGEVTGVEIKGGWDMENLDEDFGDD